MLRRSRPVMPVVRFAAALALATAAACGGLNSAAPPAESAQASAGKLAVSADMAAPPMAIAERSIASGQPSAPSVLPGSASAAQTGATTPSMIIRTGHALVEVDSLEPAIAAVQRIAASLGGWVGNTSLASGDREVRSATLELKIPSARYDEALAGLRPIGTVESVTSSAEDVGEEFVDLSARVANARRLEERLLTLLATRTGKLEDVLHVERELARVREEIERYQGRLRWLRTRVATSTLSVTVHEPPPLVGATPGRSVLGEAFREAWRNFVGFVAAFIAALGTVIPVLLLVGAAALAWRRFRPRTSHLPLQASGAPPVAG